MDVSKELEFYVEHLKSAVLPFWLKNGMDDELGGYFTCFSNDGGRLISTDKFTWSQGRLVWVLSELSAMDIFAPAEREDFVRLARGGAAFLMEHCLLPGGNCAFVMDRHGAPKYPDGETVYDTSIYADCFVILGLARLALRQGDEGALLFALDLYRRVMARFASGDFRTQPYPEIAGYMSHALTMTRLSIAEEMAWALEAFGVPEAACVSGTADACVEETMKLFLTPTFMLRERAREDGRPDEALYGRYINPGHTIEDLWFMLHERAGIPAGGAIGAREIAQARPGAGEFAVLLARILKSTFRAGWDDEFGGLLLFADREGGQPRGETAGMEHETMVRKIVGDWSGKLWWPHSEALYSSLLLHRFTGDEEVLDIYQKVRDYTFRTFPNPDQATGEWIQIRDRQGRPENKVVALPVKDPFHILRNLILIIRLLQGWMN